MDQTPLLCTQCAHHVLPRGTRQDDNIHRCAAGARRNVVNGKPEESDCKDCYAQRAISGPCGPEGTLFATSLSASNFEQIPNAAALPLDGHRLNETGQQSGVVSGVTTAEDSVDLVNSRPHVFAYVAAGR